MKSLINKRVQTVSSSIRRQQRAELLKVARGGQGQSAGSPPECSLLSILCLYEQARSSTTPSEKFLDKLLKFCRLYSAATWQQSLGAVIGFALSSANAGSPLQVELCKYSLCKEDEFVLCFIQDLLRNRPLLQLFTGEYFHCWYNCALIKNQRVKTSVCSAFLQQSRQFEYQQQLVPTLYAFIVPEHSVQPTYVAALLSRVLLCSQKEHRNWQLSLLVKIFNKVTKCKQTRDQLIKMGGAPLARQTIKASVSPPSKMSCRSAQVAFETAWELQTADSHMFSAGDFEFEDIFARSSSEVAVAALNLFTCIALGHKVDPIPVFRRIYQYPDDNQFCLAALPLINDCLTSNSCAPVYEVLQQVIKNSQSQPVLREFIDLLAAFSGTDPAKQAIWQLHDRLSWMSCNQLGLSGESAAGLLSRLQAEAFTD